MKSRTSQDEIGKIQYKGEIYHINKDYTISKDYTGKYEREKILEKIQNSNHNLEVKSASSTMGGGVMGVVCPICGEIVMDLKAHLDSVHFKPIRIH